MLFISPGLILKYWPYISVRWIYVSWCVWFETVFLSHASPSTGSFLRFTEPEASGVAVCITFHRNSEVKSGGQPPRQNIWMGFRKSYFKKKKKIPPFMIMSRDLHGKLLCQVPETCITHIGPFPMSREYEILLTLGPPDMSASCKWKLGMVNSRSTF